MYTPNSFSVTDPEVLYPWIERWSFGKLISARRGQIDITPLPFYLDKENGYLLAHMARENPHWQSMTTADDLKVVFDGPHGYVSPAWYSQPDGVPTWNYVTISVTGKAELIKTESESIDLLSRLTDKNEVEYGEGWSLQSLKLSHIQPLLKHLVFFRIKILEVEGKAKLSQNRSKMDRVGVIQKLASAKDTQRNDLSQLMREALKSLK